jgi:hypothetical protein
MLSLKAAAALLLASVPAAAADGAAYNELLASSGAEAPPLPPVHVGVVSSHQLLNMRRRTLEELYEKLEPGPIPDGSSDGLASREPGTELGRISETVLGAFWEGKIFDAEDGVLINRLRTGELIRAKVFYGESWLDGKRAIIIDYQDTSAVAGFIRDEIRQAAPGIYLGFAYARRPVGQARADIVFALDFNAPK